MLALGWNFCFWRWQWGSILNTIVVFLEITWKYMYQDGTFGYFICCCSVTQSFLTLCDPMDCSMPGLSVSLTISKVCWSSCPLHRWWRPTISSSDDLFFCPQSFPASGTFPFSQMFKSDAQNTGSFSFSINSSNEYAGLISLKIDWFGLAVQGTCRSLLQHHSSKASVLRCSAFSMVQLSQLYVTTGKTIALTIQTFISRVMSLLSNTLSRFVIAFLPRSKCLQI